MHTFTSPVSEGGCLRIEFGLSAEFSLQQTPQKSMNLAGCFARKKMSSICYTLKQSGIHDPNRFRVLESEQDFLEVHDLSVTDFDTFFS
jgi:hypothetical protein